jgi:hypothetical protein
MPYSNLALDADRENGPAARSFAADAHDGIMVRINILPHTSLWHEDCPMASSPRILNRPTDRHRPDTQAMQEARLAVHHRSACSGLKALRNTSAARRPAAKLCYRFGPLTPSARSANLIAGDGTKNDFPAPNKEPATNQKPLLDRKSPIQVRIWLPPAASRYFWPHSSTVAHAAVIRLRSAAVTIGGIPLPFGGALAFRLR